MFGSTWMHNHDIIFDIENQKIGIIKANCTENKDFNNAIPNRLRSLNSNDTNTSKIYL